MQKNEQAKIHNRFKKIISAGNALLSESGSYTIEASVALVAFIISIAFVYSQIKVLVCENIMQNAVNNMAKETASYIYILDKMGLIINHSDNELEDANNFIDSLSDEYNNVIDIVFKDNKSGETITVEGITGDVKSIGDSIKNIVTILKKTDYNKLKDELPTAAVYTGEQLIKAGINSAMSRFYKWKLNAYLPSDYDSFCKHYNIDKDSLNFSLSGVLPTSDNNSVLVSVQFDIKSQFSFIKMERHIVRYAYTAAWVKSNAK